MGAEAELRVLNQAADEEFARNRRIHGRRIVCRVGCTDCCAQPFHLSDAEAARIRAFVAEVAPETRPLLRVRAEHYLAERERLFAEQGLVESRGALLSPEKRIPCPALAGGRCTIYEARPLLCRRFGAPVFRPAEPDRLYACEKNFRPGEKIEDPALQARQERLGVLRKDVEEAYAQSGERRAPEPLTVAHALL